VGINFALIEHESHFDERRKVKMKKMKKKEILKNEKGKDQ